MRFTSIRIVVQDSKGSSAISLEKIPYRSAYDKITSYLDFVLKGEEDPVTIKLTSTAGKESLEREFIDLEPAEAGDEVVGFLAYMYGIDSTMLDIIGEQEKSLPAWIDQDPDDLTQKDKLFLLLKNGHTDSWVRSQDIQSEYEIVYGEDIQLSAVSTYLSRFHGKGLVERRGTRAQREYMLPAGKAEASAIKESQ